MPKPNARALLIRAACARTPSLLPALRAWTRKRRGCASSSPNCWRSSRPPSLNPGRRPKARPNSKSRPRTKTANSTLKSPSTTRPSRHQTASSSCLPRFISTSATSRRNTSPRRAKASTTRTRYSTNPKTPTPYGRARITKKARSFTRSGITAASITARTGA